MEVVGALLVAAGNGWAWGFESTTSPGQVLPWGTTFGMYCLGVVLLHARRAWRREHMARLEAEDKLETDPRPKLAINYTARLAASGLGEPPDVPITVSNVGPEDAFNVTFSDIRLHDNCYVQFPGLPRVPANSTVTLVPDVARYSADDHRHLENSHQFGAGVLLAMVLKLDDKSGPNVVRWPLRVAFSDYRGNQYFAEHELTVGRDNLFEAQVRLIESGLIRSVASASSPLTNLSRLES